MKDISLGLAVSHATCQKGQVRTLSEIAAFCECGRSTIQQIEIAALRKIRRNLRHADAQTKAIILDFINPIKLL